MRFDDRLSTVLGLFAEAPRDRAVQWRQLVELVARGAGASDPPLLQRALERIAVLRDDVPDAVRAAAARAIAGPGLPIALVALFVDRTEIAAPLLASSDLDAGAWAEIWQLSSPDVRELMDLIRPATDRNAPEPAEESSVQPNLAPPEDIQSPALFRWECGPTGEIDWVEGAPRAALIGRSVADDFEQRFAARLPFSDEPLVLSEEGALSGEWKWSGTPAFFPDTGRFAGYHGSARRGDASGVTAASQLTAGEAVLESHRLRELIHELRTPLTAIIGFGEIIEGQILGPAHRAYRNRAGEIVRQARRLLAAVDDLDLAAKLQSANARTGTRTSAIELVRSIGADFSEQLASRRLHIDVGTSGEDAYVRLELNLAQRLLCRFVGAVLAAAAEQEQLTLAVARMGGHVGFALDLPSGLRRVSEEQLFDPAFTGQGESGLGIGFALRLARGLATISGGNLEIAAGKIVLKFPSAQA